MGVMAGAALIGGSGLLAVETVAMIALAATAVGYVTENKTLMKIGAGLSLGSGIGSLVNSAGSVAGETAATATVENTGQSALADVGTSQAADESLNQALNQGGEVMNNAGNVPAASGPAAAEGVQQTAAAEGVQQAGNQGLVDSVVKQTPTQGVPSAAESALTSSPGMTVDASKPLVSEYGFDLTKVTTPQAGVNPNLANGKSWWTVKMEEIGKWWEDLKPESKLVVGQMGMGLVSGVGKGIMENQALERKMQFEEEARDYKRRNLAGVPSIGYTRPITTGLINSARGGL